jgi:hypothetical protein
MAKPTIKEFHNYMNNDLPKEILKRYKSFLVLSEADLQSHVWQILYKFFRKIESKPGLHKILNKPYLQEINIHPDLVVFRRDKPWIIIELKERKRFKQRTASKESQRLIKARKHFKSKYDYKLKRGYLLYVSRYGDGKVLSGPKGEGTRFFFEIPIILESFRNTDDIKKWEKEFKKWAKYVSKP